MPRQSLKQSNNTQTTVRIIIIASLPGSQGEVSELRRNAINLDWMFLSNHAHILICIGQEPEVRLREVAARVGITERAVQRIVADLEERRYLVAERRRRCNHCELHADRPFRHSVVAHRDASLPWTVTRPDGPASTVSRPASHLASGDTLRSQSAAFV